MKTSNKKTTTKNFVATKLFWIGLLGTYIIAGILLNRLKTNTSYEELVLSYIIPFIFYFFILFLSYKSFKPQAIRTIVLQFATQMLLLLPLLSMYMAVLLFTAKSNI